MSGTQQRSVASVCTAAALAVGSPCVQPHLCLIPVALHGGGCGKSVVFQAAVEITIKMAS